MGLAVTMVETGQRCPCGGPSGQGECDRPIHGHGLCQPAYQRRHRAWLHAMSGTEYRPVVADVVCHRCQDQLDALAEDRGYGDRLRFFANLTQAEFAVYLLGWYDAMGGDVNAIDKAQAIRRGEDVTWWKEAAVTTSSSDRSRRR